MAKVLTRCPDCDREVSTRAVVCPGCGRPLRVDLVLKVGLVLVLFGIYVVRAVDVLHRMLR